MAVIVCINSLTVNDVQDWGDIVHVFKDTHVFSDIEQKKFTFYAVPGTVTTYQEYIRNNTTITSTHKFPVGFTGTTIVIKNGSVLTKK